jgi:pyruvate kinase
MDTRSVLRKTKIIATIGPACDDDATLRAMIAAGMNVARLNLSHGDLDQHARRVERVRRAADEAGMFVAVMIDTRGIEIRTGALTEERVELVPDAEFRLYAAPRAGDASGVSVSYPELVTALQPGESVLIDDGSIELRAVKREGGALVCRVVVGGFLRARKSINLPDSQLFLRLGDASSHANLLQEVVFSAEHNVDYIAASFVQSADDVQAIRALLAQRSAEIPIIAKIENRNGVNNLEEIVAAADGTMVARGDLGVEMPLAEVPGTQKKIIRATVFNGKPVITATQMLDSMERNPKPTRAEASDVANAILDGTSAVMLSGETAMGNYPVLAVRTMGELAVKAESYLKDYGHLQKIRPNPANVVTEAVAQAAVSMAATLGAAAILSLTATGFTSRQVSKHRPVCPILAITTSPLAARRLSLNWGVMPLLCSDEQTDEEKIEFAVGRAKQLGYLAPGDLVVATAGLHQRPGTTDQIRVIKV